MAITAKDLRVEATVSRAGVQTYLAGLERKRSRSFLLMSHGCLCNCIVFERILLCSNVPAIATGEVLEMKRSIYVGGVTSSM